VTESEKPAAKTGNLIPERQTPPADPSGHSLSAKFLHDLRTPLNQILGYSEMLTEQAIEDGQTGYLADLQKIHTASRQLLALLTPGAPPLPEANSPTTASTQELPQPAPAAETDASLQSSILIVDDSKTNRDMLARRLERQGYGVVRAESGHQALEMLRMQEFDLVLLDIMMPEMDGFAVLQQIKADEALCHLSVIMISALEELESVAHCIEMGAEDYLPKPSNPTLLKARIAACLERKHIRQREIGLFQQLQLSNRRLEELEKLLDQAAISAGIGKVT